MGGREEKTEEGRGGEEGRKKQEGKERSEGGRAGIRERETGRHTDLGGIAL